MQLRNARLCLDCEEVHDAAHCPACASESFAFITRWVPSPSADAATGCAATGQPGGAAENVPHHRSSRRRAETLDTYRQLLGGPAPPTIELDTS